MKRNILESLGVPENILNSAKKLYNTILKELSRETNESFDEDTTFDISFSTDLMINELNIKYVNLRIELEFVGTDEMLMKGMGYAPRYTHDIKRYVSVSLEDFRNLHMSIALYLPEDEEIPLSKIINFLKTQTRVIEPSLAHELKHAYDQSKSPKKPITHTVEYGATSNFGAFGIMALRKFFHLIYLSTLTETLVKPTEVASRMSLDNVDKKGFLEFLLNDGTFQEFMQLKDYTFDTLVNELKDDIDTIKSRLEHNNIDVPSSDEETVKLILDLGYINLVNDKGEMLKHLLISGENDPILKFMEFMGGIDPESEKGEYFHKNLNKFSKYRDNPLQFYKNTIKMFNFVGDKMTKKIGKLYAMAQDPQDEYSDVIKRIYIKTNKNG